MELASIINLLSLTVMMHLSLVRNRGLGLELKYNASIKSFSSILIAYMANQALEMWLGFSWVEIARLGMNRSANNTQ